MASAPAATAVMRRASTRVSSRPWPPAWSPAAPASSARTSATSCSRAGNRVICVDNFETGSLANIEHIRDPERFVHVGRRHHRAVLRRRAGRLRLPPRLAGLADRLPAPAAAHAQGRLLRHPPHARPGQGQARALPDRLDQRGLRRPAGAPAAETYWGHVNPIGPRGVYDEAKRYAEALTMAYHRQQGVDTAIVRIFNTYGTPHAPARRPRDPDVPAPGARQPADHGVRRRQPDALVLLRQRPDPRASSRSPSPATTTRSTSATPTSSRCSSWPRRSRS